MSFRHSLIFTGLLLVLFLAMYTWNRSTGILDTFATNIGLELTGVVINPIRHIQDTISGTWNNYIDLVHVREENIQLTKRVRELEAQLLAHSEDMAELRRLYGAKGTWKPGRLLNSGASGAAEWAREVMAE